jgi:CRP-like cAMP-binding protein
MPDRETVDFLTTVPLLDGHEEADLVELARVMRPRRLREGELVWRQGDHAREMLVIVDGTLSAWLDMPGGRTMQIARAGPRDTVGEIGLLDGRGHTASIRVAEAATVLALSRRSAVRGQASQPNATPR